MKCDQNEYEKTYSDFSVSVAVKETKILKTKKKYEMNPAEGILNEEKREKCYTETEWNGTEV